MLSRLTHEPSASVNLELAQSYLKEGRYHKEAAHLETAFILYENARVSLVKVADERHVTPLSQVKDALRKAQAPQTPEGQALRDDLAAIYLERGEVLEAMGKLDKAKASYEKAKTWGHVGAQSKLSPATRPSSLFGSINALRSRLSLETPGLDAAQIALKIFTKDVSRPVADHELSEVDDRLTSTAQLAYCLSLLSEAALSGETLEKKERLWSQATASNTEERERLQTLATDLIRAFINDELKDEATVAEILCVAPALKSDSFQKLLATFVDGVNQPLLLDFHLVEGLARLIQSAAGGSLKPDDLVKILTILNTRLQETHGQSTDNIYQLTRTVANVLDAMADSQVTGLDREKLHAPLADSLDGLQGSGDPYLIYKAAYAAQALLYVPDNETPWDAAWRRTTKVIDGGIVSAVKAFDLKGFVDGLQSIQQGVAEVVVEGAMSLYESGQDLIDSLREGFAFKRKSAWYTALRGSDTLLEQGQFIAFETLVRTVPCRRHPAFQWGVCERSGQIAANPLWDADTRQSALNFLSELYTDDTAQGQQASIKQWIIKILIHLSNKSVSAAAAKTVLVKLKKSGDAETQKLYKKCLKEVHIQYPLNVVLPPLTSSSLLDRVQNKPDIGVDLRKLRRQRLQERGGVVYISPQAKPSLEASDETLFDLKVKVNEFLNGKQKVMLILGDSGSGKSTFNRMLEKSLWHAYTQKKDLSIPLFIDLPAIDEPEQDLIPKHLRKVGFTEPQIRELKERHQFVLICDGYDESQQTHNLYVSNQLNEPGEWQAQMVISCRSEYIGLDYRDRFQSTDRNHQAKSALFQEAVMAPFSKEKIDEYIKQYVAVSRPLWQAKDYKMALEQIPHLQDLVKNPFLLTLALDVLPRMVDVGSQKFSSVRVTRVALYDQFVEHWLERNKKRLGDKKLSELEKKAFESLSDEGFTQNGIVFLKNLAAAIYKHQAGRPVVEYSHFRDRGTWKEEFFGEDVRKQLLREAMPLTRSGNRYRFIHTSLLEYAAAESQKNFPENENQLVGQYGLPQTDARLSSTLQLAYALSLLSAASLSDAPLSPEERAWSQALADNADETERLHTLATDVVRAFINDELKDATTVTEVVCLVPTLEYDLGRKLFMKLVESLVQNPLLDFDLLEGVNQLIRHATPGTLEVDDLVKLLTLLSARLQDTHAQATLNQYQLTRTISLLLDAMADSHVTDLQREQLHEPLKAYLKTLQDSPDAYLVYQAAYAYQALQYVPDDETPWQGALRRTGKVLKGVFGLVSAVKGLNLNEFINGLKNIQEGVAGASGIIKTAAEVYEGGVSLTESGQNFLACLKEGLSFSRKRDWYPTLRLVDTLLQTGQLTQFKQLIGKVSCRRNLAFQWGLGERLGQFAANPVWDTDTRQDAIDFLGELYQDEATWGQQPQVKEWIRQILSQLAETSVSATEAHALLKILSKSRPADQPVLSRTAQQAGPRCALLNMTSSLPVTFPLLDRVQHKLDVEPDLRQLKHRRLAARSEAVYIPPQSKPNRQASNTLFDLTEEVNDFLAENKKKVFLLLGDSGAGKSTFNRRLEADLWDKYQKGIRIPLFITLPAIDKPQHDLITKHLRKEGFTEPQIKELKTYRDFIVICDGYDESQQTQNLYMSNRLNQPGEWQAQMVISCRSEYLGADYRDRFQPTDRNHRTDSTLFEEAVIAPFSAQKMASYIEQYVQIEKSAWPAEVYQQALKRIPHLKELVRNPFLLTLALEVLPRLVAPGQDFSTARITRVALYDEFVVQWLERGKKRLEETLSGQKKEAFERLTREGFTRNGLAFLTEFATAIYEQQVGNPVVEYAHFRDRKTWKEEFFGRDNEKQLLLEACPLIRNDNQYRFIHKSLLEYGVARAIFEPQDGEKYVERMPVQTRRGSVSSVFSFENQDGLKETASAVEQPVLDSLLVRRNLVGEPSIVQFLAERVQQAPRFKQQLLAIIERSKTDKAVRQAAANAITVLVRAGVTFNGVDLKSIQIPGADLSHGVFDSAQLQGADLRKVHLRTSWLRNANLSSAQMAGVQFGEWPTLEEEGKVYSCAYSPDGKTCAIGLENGTVSVYDALHWEKIHPLQGHTGWVNSVTYSPSGQQIASGSQDHTVRLWDAYTGQPSHTLQGHTSDVSSVMYSPSGQQIASGSQDHTVRLWNAHTGQSSHTLQGHTGWVNSVTYSPSGQQIASGSQDHTVRLWDAHTGQPSRTLQGHTSDVSSVTYSPSGQQIASGSQDKTVRLWDAQTGQPSHTLQGHTSDVSSVTYSPNGQQIASGSQDHTVRLWDAQTGQLSHILQGHTSYVSSVTYSPGGQQIASGSQDKTVRLWAAHIGQSSHILQGHTSYVSSVTYSPSGQQLASGSRDQTIRLWDAQTGQPSHTLQGHTSYVSSVTYSPNGQQIASGSQDKTVRLWDAQTGQPSHTLQGHTSYVSSVTYSPNGQQIASGSQDKTVRLWNAQTGQPSHTLQGHTSYVSSVTYSPNGQQIASGSQDHTVRLWDAQTGQPSHTLQGHTSYVYSVVYSPNGQQIASGSQDKTVRLWNARTGALACTLQGHTSDVSSVVYSPNGQQIASGSQDKTVRLWDIASGQCLSVMRDFHGEVTSVAWRAAPSGTYLATGCGDHSVRLWQIIEEENRDQVRLCWSSTHDRLTVTDISIQNVQGLSRMNQQLLQQRGAVGEPSPSLTLHEASKKIIRLSSVASKFRLPSHHETLSTSAVMQPNLPTESQVRLAPSANERCLSSDFA